MFSLFFIIHSDEYNYDTAEPLPSSVVQTATELRWVLTQCTMPTADFISKYRELTSGGKQPARFAKMIVYVLQSRSRDEEAAMFLQAIKPPGH